MSHKEVTAIIGEYTNAKGEVKKRYMKIGALIESKHGPMLKLDAVPLEWNGYAYINEPYDASKPKAATNRGAAGSGFDDMDDVPF